MMKHVWASLAVNWRSKEDVDTGCCEVCYLRVLQIRSVSVCIVDAC